MAGTTTSLRFPAVRIATVRRFGLPILDAAAALSASYLALAFRFDDPFPLAHLIAWFPFIALPALVRPLLNRVAGIYRHSLRHVSVPELMQLAAVTATGTVVMIGLYLAVAIGNPSLVAGFPRSFWLLEAGLSLAIMGAGRLAPRIILDLSRPGGAGDRRVPAILYGAGDAGAMMARSVARQHSTTVRPVAFLDDDQAKWGKVHAGVKVAGGLAALEATIRSTGADVLLITMPTAPGDAVRRVADAAISLGLRVRTVPSLDEMVDGSFHPDAIRPLKMEDLLRRPAVEPAVLEELAANLREERILVTGAAGSIGSELTRQLVALSPRQLVLLDRAEGPLYELQRDVQARLGDESLGDAAIHFRIGDITNSRAMHRLMESVQPTVVFHAAAYKHVPMMEENPSCAVEVNVGGTLTLLEAAEEFGVERFVLVSTDKAVDPASVMGATKRMAELLVVEFSARTGRPWVSVRFGNVLGSSGSVVPVFQKQLERGEALTVTHEDMTRFFMTIPEAVHLILQAGTMARPGDLFVLDMGEPVRIVELARDFLRLQGRDPKRTPIKISGLRPGEKLHERLFFEDEAVAATGHPKVRRVVRRPSAPSNHSAVARSLITLATEAADPELVTALAAAIGTNSASQGGERLSTDVPGIAIEGRSQLISATASGPMK